VEPTDGLCRATAAAEVLCDLSEDQAELADGDAVDHGGSVGHQIHPVLEVALSDGYGDCADDHRHEATANDVVGMAVGEAYGKTFRWEYSLVLNPENIFSRVHPVLEFESLGDDEFAAVAVTDGMGAKSAGRISGPVFDDAPGASPTLEKLVGLEARAAADKALWLQGVQPAEAT
jgi:hypothetical protein